MDKIVFTADHPATRIVADVIRTGVQKGIRSLSVVQEKEHAEVTYLDNGTSVTLAVIPSAAYQEVLNRLKVLSGLELFVKGIPQEGSFEMEVDGKKTLIGVSVVPDQSGEKAILELNEQQ